MQTTIHGSPSFAYLDVELGPGESIVAESDAMATMARDIDMVTSFNGGFVRGLLRKFLGGESLFVNTFTNAGKAPRRLTLVQSTPGDMREARLQNASLCLQPGAFIACSPGISLGVQWAGFGSLIAREGLFKLLVSGTGTVWYGAYGAIIEKAIDGEHVVDTGHLVAYEPHMRLKVQLAGGIFSSFFGGEGLVTRVEGKGRLILQTRSLSGLAGWLNPRL
jgi:uncharacterized protein (TIGR00266 family)